MKSWKNKSTYLFTVLFATLCLALSADVWAGELSALAGGPPDGKGRKPDNPGGTTKGDLLGDLWVVARDVTPTGDGNRSTFPGHGPLHVLTLLATLTPPSRDAIR